MTLPTGATRTALRFTQVVFDGHDAGRWGGLRPQPRHLDLPTSISNWLSASLRHFTVTSVRAILRRVRLAASRDASMTLGPDDWW